MQMKQEKSFILVPPVSWLETFLFLAAYRQEMPVHEMVVFRSPFYGLTGYYRCPRCHTTMEREFTAFCDCCGQHLGWKDYKKAKKIDPGIPSHN